MASTLSQLDQRVTSLVHKCAGSMSESDRYALGSLALDMLGKDVDLYESQRKTVLTPALYAQMYEYAFPSDVKGDAIIDIRPAGKRDFVYEKKTMVPFDFESRNGSALPDFSVEVREGTRILRINSQDVPVYSLINDCASTTDNGTWAASDDAANLTADTDGMGDNNSLRFDVDVSASVNNDAILTNSTMDAVDLTDFQYVGSTIFKVWLPDNTYITSVALRIGSDVSNYYSATKTTQADGTAISKGVNTFRIDWGDWATTGTPTITAIDYVQFTLNYSASQTDMFGVRLDDIVIRTGKNHEILYYSEFIAANSSGTRQRTFSTSTDTTILGSEAEDALVFKWAELIAAARREWTTSQTYAQKYVDSIGTYQMRYPSQRPYLGFEYQQFGSDPNNPDKPRYV